MQYHLRDGFTDPDDLESFSYQTRAELNLFGARLHPRFFLWLVSEPKTSFNEVLDDIATLLGYFKYGKIDHFLKHVSINCNHSFSRMILHNYTDVGLDSVYGHCGEVNEKAYLLIRYKYPTLNMLKVQGQRGGFGSGWNHWFLLLSKHPFWSEGKIVFTPSVNYFDSAKMDPGARPLDTESREPQLPADIFIGDASAGTVLALDLSSYVLTPPRSSTSPSLAFLPGDPLSLQVKIERVPGICEMTVLHRSPTTMTLLSIGLHGSIPAPVIGVEEFNREQTGNNRRYRPAEYFAYDDQGLLDRLEQLSPDLVQSVSRLRDKGFLIL